MKPPIHVFYDKELKLPGDWLHDQQVFYNEAVELLPDESAEQTLYAAFMSRNPAHRLRIESFTVVGDAELKGQIPRGDLSPGDKFPVVLGWKGREMELEDLVPLEARVEIVVKVIALARPIAR